ncbi:MAG: AAA family ATPase, partial [Azonexus sp.]
TLLADGDTIDRSHLTEMAEDIPPGLPDFRGAFQVTDVVDLATLEQGYLDWAKARPGNDLPTLAGRLGISQRTLYRKLQAKG